MAKKKVHADGTYMISPSSDNPRIGSRLVADGKESLFLDYYMGLDENKKCVLIVGGSLGARSINEAVLANIDLIKENEDNTIINITATTSDKNANVIGTGNIKLTDGMNNIKITVVAENGDVQEYKVTVIREKE